MSELTAVLLDLDGTLVDTAELWRSAYTRLADELDVTLTADFWSQVAGRSMADSLDVFGPQRRSPDQLITRLGQLASADLTANGGPAAVDRPVEPQPRGPRWLPGARELLATLREGRGGPDSPPLATALVTSSWRPFTEALLAAPDDAMRLDHAFDAIVCGEDIADGKPAPEGYLRAAMLLGAAPADCLVIEDSPTGVAAAEAAGMVVLAVPRAGRVDPAPGRAVRRDLTGLTAADLMVLHARLRSGASA